MQVEKGVAAIIIDDDGSMVEIPYTMKAPMGREKITEKD